MSISINVEKDTRVVPESIGNIETIIPVDPLTSFRLKDLNPFPFGEKPAMAFNIHLPGGRVIDAIAVDMPLSTVDASGSSVFNICPRF